MSEVYRGVSRSLLRLPSTVGSKHKRGLTLLVARTLRGVRRSGESRASDQRGGVALGKEGVLRVILHFQTIILMIVSGGLSV